MRRVPFFQAFVLALLVHVVCFCFFVFTWKGSFKDYQVDFVFWGGILRHQELMPVSVEQGRGDRSVRIIAPSSILAPVQMNAWRLGSSVEKPESVRTWMEGKAAPAKFMTERVDLDGPAQGTAGNSRFDIPEPPRVYLGRTEP